MSKTDNCRKLLLFEMQNNVLNPLPEVEEDGQRDEQGGYG